MDLQLSSKTVLVTGSSKGIGKAIAMALAREGASVIVHGRDGAEANRVVHAIVENGGRAHAVLGDLTHDEAVERLIAEAEARVESINIWSTMQVALAPKTTGRRPRRPHGHPHMIGTSLLPSVPAHASCQPCGRPAGAG